MRILSLASKLGAHPGWLCFGVALLFRGLVAWWGAARFPPVADGTYYQIVAERIARGEGYTWLWPDGAVTYAAHYPVGYPAVLGAAYRLFGSDPSVAMALNALVGAAGALAAHRILAEYATARGALLGGLAVALHPSLLLYTPALMTEAVVGSGVLLLGWASIAAGKQEQARKRHWLQVAACVGLGALALFRPQLVLLAPVVAALVFRPRSVWRWGAASLLVLAGGVLVTLPWTARNCSRMDQCVWISANGGWNLLIGAGENATGAWVGLDQLGFPVECKEVWGEVEKDVCFSRAARRQIRMDPLRWVSLIPAKLSHTFNYGDAPGWYLHESNSQQFGSRSRAVSFVVELLVIRLTALGLLVGLLRRARALGGTAGRIGLGVGLASLPFVFMKWLWPAYLGALALGLLLRPREPGLLLGLWCLGATLLTHAVFFGASRYALIVTPALVVAAIGVLTARRVGGDTLSEPGGDA